MKRKCSSTAAKKKIKAHLDRYATSGTSFDVTELKTQYWFNIINKAAFRGKLPQPVFVVKKLKGMWGECVDYRDIITVKINTEIDSRELFLATLSHELVHVWQTINENKMSHTQSFLYWKRYFKKNFNVVL